MYKKHKRLCLYLRLFSEYLIYVGKVFQKFEIQKHSFIVSNTHFLSRFQRQLNILENGLRIIPTFFKVTGSKFINNDHLTLEAVGAAEMA